MFSRSLISKALNLSPSQTATHVGADFQSICTDSRKISSGALFVAITGDQFDGHQFIPMALEKGATGILTEKAIGSPAPFIEPSIAIYQVPSTVEAYGKIAKAWRELFQIPVIGVTGSNGKTTTKELLTSILQGHYSNVLKTQGSQNGFVGIPMTLLELRAEHQAAVIEIGIDEIGAMEKHIALVHPTHILQTIIGPEHLEKLIDLHTVAKEELRALSLVDQYHGVLILNFDDPYIHKASHGFKSKQQYSCSLATGSSSEHPSPSPFHLCAKIHSKTNELVCSGIGLQQERFSLPLPGRHNSVNLLIAITAALSLGLTPQEIKKGLSRFQAAEGRTEIKKILNHSLALCDYYNANPSSMQAALKLLTELSAKTALPSKRWACLGDMLELGPNEEQFHRNLATVILQEKTENVLLFGPRMKFLFQELQTQGFPGILQYFSAQEQMGQFLVKHFQEGDVLLIKGSRGMKMENIWKYFTQTLHSKT